ncbi:MAG: alpha/beta hydrolase [Acidobacteriaceae bacterium]|nr:alpha/beta hydrolase [Acidobacteriaceae bacterium]
MTAQVTRFEHAGDPPVRGFLHLPRPGTKDALVFTHGAGSDCGSPLVVAIASAFSDAGLAVLRCDLPFRQLRPHGPPRGNGEADRQGLKSAVKAMRERFPGRVFLGGQSYGGRQATMLCAAEPDLAHGLLLTSYPLHAPGQHAFRTVHFPDLKTDSLVVHGGRDPFASSEEIQSALKLIPARTRLLEFEALGHDLAARRKIDPAMVSRIIETFAEFFAVELGIKLASAG